MESRKWRGKWGGGRFRVASFGFRVGGGMLEAGGMGFEARGEMISAGLTIGFSAVLDAICDDLPGRIVDVIEYTIVTDS